jgi:hypothetical protein
MGIINIFLYFAFYYLENITYDQHLVKVKRAHDVKLLIAN